MRHYSRLATALAVAILSGFFSACGGTQTAPSGTSTTTTATVAAPTITETFDGTVAVGGSRFYSFSTAQNGTVTVTLTSVGGQFVPSTITLGVGVGTPNGTDCTTSTSVSTSSGSTAQVTMTLSPGVYCARVYDVGNLFAAATFSATIAHP
jgi:hypothetical protein